jgi:hypothetical protein
MGTNTTSRFNITVTDIEKPPAPPRPTPAVADHEQASFAFPPEPPTVTLEPTANTTRASSCPDHTLVTDTDDDLPANHLIRPASIIHDPNDVTSNNKPALSIADISKIYFVQTGNLPFNLFASHMAPSQHHFHDPPNHLS